LRGSIGDGRSTLPNLTSGDRRRPESKVPSIRNVMTVAQLRQTLDDIDEAEVVVELPGSFRSVDGISIRSTPEHGTQLVVLADL